MRQDHKVHWANGNSMMCFKKCLYGTLLDGVQKGEGGGHTGRLFLWRRGGRLITAGLWEHSGRGINHLGSPSP